MKKDDIAKSTIFILLLVVLGIVISFIFNYNENKNNTQNKKIYVNDDGKALEYELRKYDDSCITKIEEKIVRGNSLSGLIENNTTVKILFGYYNCNQILRNDLALYNYTANPEPIVKIVKGIPNDKFILRKEGDFWHIIINGEVVKNSKNKPYQLSDHSYNLLNLYVKDYKEKIPANSYLLLGNLANGSVDSTAFGLVDKSDVLGKVAT